MSFHELPCFNQGQSDIIFINQRNRRTSAPFGDGSVTSGPFRELWQAGAQPTNRSYTSNKLKKRCTDNQGCASVRVSV